MLIDFKKEKILNKCGLCEEALRMCEKDSDFIVIIRNHFSSGTYVHIESCSFNLQTLVKTAALCYDTLPINKSSVHEERIYRREDKKLLFRTAAI